MLHCQKNFSDYVGKLEKLISSSPFSEDDMLSSLKRKILETELVVPVIGAFSSGKSTLINAFLGSSVLSVGITPETELATELRYAPDSYLLAIKKDGTEERFSVDALTEVNRRSSEFLFLRLYLNNAALKDIAPLVLVDMPGFGSSLENHNKAISFYMPRGVHFIVLTSVEEGSITQSMLRQLNEIRDYGADFSFLLSKADLRAPEEVREVADYIGEQILHYLDDTHRVIPVSIGDGQPLDKALRALNPEAMFSSLFYDQLKDRNFDTIEQINLALRTLSQDAEQRNAELAALEKALRELETQQESAIAEAKSKFSRNALTNCLKNVDQALQNSLEEFIKYVLSRNQQGLSNSIADVIRGSLKATIQSELDSASKAFVGRITESMSSLHEGALLAQGQNWAQDLGSRVQASLRSTTQVLEGWKAVLEKASDANGSVLYKTISTILAVTTNIINPIVELLIVFLPEIIRFFVKGNERAKIREKLLTEIFPGIKAELRRHLPEILNKELDVLLNAIRQEFETQIVRQKQIIDSFDQEQAASAEKTSQRKAELEELRTAVQQLATQYLYMEA